MREAGRGTIPRAHQNIGHQQRNDMHGWLFLSGRHRIFGITTHNRTHNKAPREPAPTGGQHHRTRRVRSQTFRVCPSRLFSPPTLAGMTTGKKLHRVAHCFATCTKLEEAHPLPDARPPYANRTAILPCPLLHMPMPGTSSVRVRVLIPRAASSPCPLQYVQATSVGGTRARPFVPGAAVRPSPFKHF